MFIGIFSKLHGDRNEPCVVYYDATRIIKVTDVDVDEGCIFWFHDADVGGALPYEAPSYSAAGLIELVMTARLRPLEFLPSLYVGKSAPADDNPNNVSWSAQKGVDTSKPSS